MKLHREHPHFWHLSLCGRFMAFVDDGNPLVTCKQCLRIERQRSRWDEAPKTERGTAPPPVVR